MKYISFCSGVEAASVAWEPLGWTPVAFSEIDDFPNAVLKYRFPDVPNLGDCTKIHYNQAEKVLCNDDTRIPCEGIDLSVGGFPCQSFSVAGKRAGLAGESGLVLEYIRLLDEIRPRWLVYENVPGMFSSNGGWDFAAVLSSICKWEVPVPEDGWRNAGICLSERGGYGVAWRVLDAQFTRTPRFPRAIPQRRRRVFLVGYRSQPDGDPLDWQHSASVLFDGESLFGNPPARGKAREKIAGDTVEGPDGAGGRDAGTRGDGDK